MITKYKLKNNISVASYRIPELRSFHLRLSIKGGSLGENESNNGLAHFMEHMLVQGIPSYPNAQLLSEYVEGLAGSYGAFTTSLTVSYSISVPAAYTEEAIKIASEVLFQPLFPNEAIEKERNAVINEIKQKMDARWYKFNQFFTQKRYIPGSPLQIKTVGSIKAVESLTRDDLINYWQKYFIPQNTFIVAEGNMENEKLQHLLDKYFQQKKKKDSVPAYPKLSKQEFSERLVAIRQDSDLKTNYIDFTFPALSMKDELLERMKQNIALVILGRLRSSRLFKLLRYEKGLLYDVSTSDAQFPGLGFVNVSAEVRTENLDEVIQLIAKTIKEFIQKGPTSEELTFTKNYISNSWLMSFDNPDSIADWIENELLWKEIIRLPEEYIALIKEITADDIKKTIQKNWDLQKLNLIIQGSIEDSENNREKYNRYMEILK
jgi:predicted Zn-dependent peptidase